MPVFTVNKSIQIDAPIEKVYESVRDFRQWRAWSPWLLAEPDSEMDYAADGKSYTWDGNIVGAGEMAITDEKRPKSIDYRLTFLKPWKSVNRTRFLLAEKGGGTEVTWTMEGSLPFLFFFLKGMMAAMVGMDYERGLKMLKDHLEGGEVPSQLEFDGVESYAGCHYIGVRTTTTIAEIGPEMEKSFAKLVEFFGTGHAERSGAPVSVYHKWNLTKGLTEFTCGFPVAEVPAKLPADLVAGEIPPCSVYAIRHTGPYRHLGNAWSAGEMHARAKPKIFSRDKKIDPFEVYENDPDEVPEREVLTVVNFPTK